jgi:hypothetical protein
MFAITKMRYDLNIATMPENAALAMTSIATPDIFIFGLFFALAMINRRNPNVHARYMIGTALLIIPAGIGRAFIIFGGLPFPVGIHISYFISTALALLLLFHDFRKSVAIKPAITVLIFLVISHICYAAQNTGWWQAFAKWFATVFF